MDHSTLFARLRELRLTDYEARCYLALLERDTLRVTEVSRIAGIPRANAYESLEKLQAKGFCISKPGRIKRYSASDPAFLMNKVLLDLNETFKREMESLKERLDSRRKNVADLVEALSPLFHNSRSDSTPLDYVEIIKDDEDRCLISQKFMQLSERAESEILAFSYPPHQGPEIAELQTSQQDELLKKGLTIRGIYEIPEDEEEKRLLAQYIETVTGRGEESRVVESLPLHMAIFDEKVVMFALEDPLLKKISLTSVVVEHRNLARTFKIAFEALWAEAAEYHVLAGKGTSTSST